MCMAWHTVRANGQGVSHSITVRLYGDQALLFDYIRCATDRAGRAGKGFSLGNEITHYTTIKANAI